MAAEADTASGRGRLVSFSDDWLDPALIDCSCWRCQAGGRCREMRQLWAKCLAADEQRHNEDALSPEDRAHLEALGWKPSTRQIPPYPDTLVPKPIPAVQYVHHPLVPFLLVALMALATVIVAAVSR